MKETSLEEPNIGQWNKYLKWIGLLISKMIGWKIQGPPPPFPKYVAIFAPHTALRDAPVGMMVSLALGIRGNFLAKDTAFIGPIGWILRFFGGLPVDRSINHNMVDQAVQAFKENDHVILAIAPDATRKPTEYWRSGFYYIALKAEVPIVLAYFDYKRKMAGNSGIYIYPTGDSEADMAKIRAFYDTITPRVPKNRSKVRFRDHPPLTPPESS
jgi:1-acyl-sn-glycerol-3-phosphate acyltransferase